MPAKDSRRQAGTSLYRWVAVRLLQKRFISPRGSSNLKCVRETRNAINAIAAREVSVDSSCSNGGKSKLPSNGEDASGRNVDEGGKIVCSPSQNRSLEGDYSPLELEKTNSVPSPSVSVKEDKPSSKCSSEVLSISSKKCKGSGSPSSYGYEQAVTDEEGGISSYRPVLLSTKSSSLNEGFNSIGSSLPSIYALSKESSCKDTEDVFHEYNSLTFQEEGFSNEASSNCSETLSDNNEDFPSEVLTKGGYEWLTSTVEPDNGHINGYVNDSNNEIFGSAEVGEEAVESKEVSIRREMVGGDETEADVSISVIVTSSTERPETPSRIKAIQKRLLCDVAPSRGSVQSLTLKESFHQLFIRKWDSIGVLYGKELLEIRHKVRERLLSILRERRGANDSAQENKPCHVPRPPKRRGLRKKERRRKGRKWEKRAVKKQENCVKECPKKTTGEGVAPAHDAESSSLNHSVKSPADSVSYHCVSESLSKCELRRTGSSLPKSKSTSSGHVESSKGEPNSQSDSPSILSSAERDKNRYKRGSPPPRSTSFITRVGVEVDNRLLHPLQEESPVRKSLFCPCFSSLKFNKVSKGGKKRYSLGYRPN